MAVSQRRRTSACRRSSRCGPSGAASRRAISRSQSRIDWRCTSVGCAVSTGLTTARSNHSIRVASAAPAARARFSACVNVPGDASGPASPGPGGPALAGIPGFVCASSARLSRCEKWLNARTTCSVRTMSSASRRASSSAFAAALSTAGSDSERRKRTAVCRMRSISSSISGPAWSRITSPSSRPRSRRLSRRACSGSCVARCVSMVGQLSQRWR